MERVWKHSAGPLIGPNCTTSVQRRRVLFIFDSITRAFGPIRDLYFQLEKRGKRGRMGERNQEKENSLVALTRLSLLFHKLGSSSNFKLRLVSQALLSLSLVPFPSGFYSLRSRRRRLTKVRGSSRWSRGITNLN